MEVKKILKIIFFTWLLVFVGTPLVFLLLTCLIVLLSGGY